jgi:hypothetical protein
VKLLFLIAIFLFGVNASAPVVAAENKGSDKPIQSSQPVICYKIAWGNRDKGEGFGLTAGQAIRLCGGATDAQKILQCFAEAWTHPDNGGLGLTAGQAVDLCKTDSLQSPN